MKLLEAQNLSKNFGGVAALVDVSFGVSRGQILGVIGPNGAGKTTLFNCLSGVESVGRGEIRFNGKDLTQLTTHQIVRLGLVRTFQTTRAFSHLTVLENVMVGCHIHTRSNLISDLLKLPLARRENLASREAARVFLKMVKLADLADLQADQLTLSQTRRMELARALATSPQLLLLDEPGAGLDEKETADLTDLLTEIHGRGITLTIIEHDIGFLVNLCSEIMVLNFGELIAWGTPEEVQTNEDVLAAYLGKPDEC